ncbi:hypothetical protein SCOR_27950 [Sulfidibacter corallicola]|uniref:Teneurin-like YD-shell domain-containing protein n=1 Tax=Sulfidibacter corallicola TaxID=2818388 RepID=A0A8A4TM15_SULCO|nr:hypothetical protein [Sulfidibacter corallicola]QTD50610.1 hypothetical protein J3U87_33920 [Sulfidibacter corallicola]
MRKRSFSLCSLIFLHLAFHPALVAQSPPTCQNCANGNILIEQDLVIDLGGDVPSYTGDPDLNPYVRSQREGDSPSQWTIHVEASNQAPEVAIEAPVNFAEFTEPAEFLISVQDENLVSWSLSYTLKGRDCWQQIEAGTGPIERSYAGLLPTHLLPNGLYTVRLTATDLEGETTTLDHHYRVYGRLDLGSYHRSFEELSIPTPGLPLGVTRTYHAGDACSGDFGRGWRLPDLVVQDTTTMGGAWNVTKTSVGGTTRFCIEELAPHYIHIVYPDGETGRFAFVLDNPCQTVSVPVELTGRFVAMQGTRGTLIDPDHPQLRLRRVFGENPRYVVVTPNGNLYDPQRFVLSTPERIHHEIVLNEGIVDSSDELGNGIEYRNDGISHTAGLDIRFERDEQGRITTLFDPMGNPTHYEYDAEGHLQAVYDATGNPTLFGYDEMHRLIEITGPVGNLIAHLEYDPEGLLNSRIEPGIASVQYGYDFAQPGAARRTETDFVGNMREVMFDTFGNPIREVDPNGIETHYGYDHAQRLMARTVAVGTHLEATTTWIYDLQGNLHTVTDAEGNTTTYDYDSTNRLHAVRDSQGEIESYAYDSVGRLAAVTDAMGHTTTFEHQPGPEGMRTITTDPLGHSTVVERNHFGFVIGEIDANGNETWFSHDEMGRVLTTSKQVFDEFGSQMHWRWETEYDVLGRIIRESDPTGASTHTEYDEAGRVTTRIDGNGNRTEYRYDEMNNPMERIRPDGIALTASFDLNGNRISQMDAKGRETTFEYDAHQRLTRTSYPDGTVEEREYDEAGNVIREMDRDGRSRHFEDYTLTGKPRGIHIGYDYFEQYQYDLRGNVTSARYGHQPEILFAYDSKNRLIQREQAGARFTWDYDELDRVIRAEDALNNATGYHYDPNGNRIGVMDARGHYTHFEYDAMGNQIAEVDPLGRRTARGYDHAGRMIRTTLPMGEQETYSYDPNGNLGEKHDFNGQSFHYHYDAFDRLIERQLPDGHESYEYDLEGLRTAVYNRHGATIYHYNGEDRLELVEHPDGSWVSYHYEWSSGKVTRIETANHAINYGYDHHFRLTEVDDQWTGVTRIEYDSLGNRIAIVRPNDTSTHFDYDEMGRVLEVRTQGAGGAMIQATSYLYDPMGNRIMVSDSEGAQSEFGYDETYQLVEEHRFDPNTGQSRAVSYGYDEVGNRVERFDHERAIHYEYDDNGRLLRAGDREYSYDQAGNVISALVDGRHLEFGYDMDHRLVMATTPEGVLEFGYNVDGVCNYRSLDGQVTRYVIDGNRDVPRVLAELDENGLPRLRYTLSDDALLSVQNETSSRFHHHDDLGDTLALTDETGTVTDVYRYDPWGDPTRAEGETENPYRFRGHRFEPLLGVYIIDGRVYDPAAGRFQSAPQRETLVPQPTHPHSDIYRNNNPFAASRADR